MAHVENNSGNDEWYTPQFIIDCAHDVMGGIDLDPASTASAQKIVRAASFFDKNANGLSKDWHGRVWLNPPYSQPSICKFVEKLARERFFRRVSQAITITNNATETGWGRILLENANAVCFLGGRVKFLDQMGEPQNTPLQGQMICGFDVDGERFGRAFSEHGLVMIPSKFRRNGNLFQ